MTTREARDAMTRALFECSLWENAQLLASLEPARRQRGLDAVMAAFDDAVRTRRRPGREVGARRRRPVDVRFAADVARQNAAALFGDRPSVTRERLAELADAAREHDGRVESLRGARAARARASAA